MRLRAGLRAGLVGAQEKPTATRPPTLRQTTQTGNKQLANILCLGVCAQLGLRRLQNHYPGQDKDKKANVSQLAS